MCKDISRFSIRVSNPTFPQLATTFVKEQSIIDLPSRFIELSAFFSRKNVQKVRKRLSRQNLTKNAWISEEIVNICHKIWKILWQIWSQKYFLCSFILQKQPQEHIKFATLLADGGFPNFSLKAFLQSTSAANCMSDHLTKKSHGKKVQ